MTVSIAFAAIGAVILVGFFANLLFRATKIPSVLLLIGIGLFLGPFTGWITSASLIQIAPFFGTMALLIILFEGGMELDIESVIKQAPKAALLAVLVFVFSVASVGLFAFFVLHMSLFHSFLIAAVFGAGSPAICLPVISGLSINREIKTILKLESTLGDVLLIVTVLVVLDFQVAGGHSPMGMIGRFFVSFAVAFVIATIAGAMWSRLIGWMGKEPLAYMLTLGFVFLLYFSVEELGGSAAMAVLIFGILLENMHVIAHRFSNRIRNLFGIDFRAEQFVLNEFMKNITEELSFLVRTFFFVYLGLILDFRSLTPWIGISSAAVVLLLLASRWVAIVTMKKRCRFTSGEVQIVLSMLPRGLATAVMAFIPAQYGISGTEALPIYAFTVIVLTNILMTAGVFLAERRLGRESCIAAIAEREPSLQDDLSSSAGLMAKELGAEKPVVDQAHSFHRQTPPDRAATPVTFAGSMSRLFGIPPEEREWRFIEAVKASSFADSKFWVQIFFAAALTTLGLITNQSAIIIGAALIVPIAWPVIAAGMALTVGDIYLFIKLLAKIVLAAILTAAMAASFSALLPFTAFTAEIASRIKPTILDFLVAFFAGMVGAMMLFARRKMLQFLPGAILAVALLPPLAVMGIGLADSMNAQIFRGSAVLFIANFFAAILGAALVYALVEMPAVAGLNGIHDWKQRELNKPVVEFVFKGLGLKNLAGRTGSARSHMVVAAVFLLALVIPLQMAFNQLSLEFRARQAIADVQKMFESPGRSAIINAASNIGEDAIAVRIQVATNSFFSASDIRHFEERISDRTGKPARLDLVQSLSDIGEGGKIRGMLQPEPPVPAEYSRSIQEMTVDLRDEIERTLLGIPLPQSVHLIGVNAELGMGRQTSSLRIEYLSEIPLNEDARYLLASLLARQMKLPSGVLSFIHVPARYSASVDRQGRLPASDREQLQNIQNILERHPQLGAEVKLQRASDEKHAGKVLAALYDVVPIFRDSARVVIASDGERGNASAIALRPLASAGDKTGMDPLP